MLVMILVGKDGYKVTADIRIVEQFQTLKMMMEDLEFDDTCEIPIPTVDGLILEKLVRWSERHAADIDCSAFDKKFFEMTDDDVVDLINAADFLNNKKFHDWFLKKFAISLIDRSDEEVKQILEIK